mmetsp:Transcript_26721/g.44666  ORF Transcript_26721/g.44666 Transcript_26721/m.44666 type:complete len:685 (+) Transcript_26721:53-2107(+)
MISLRNSLRRSVNWSSHRETVFKRLSATAVASYGSSADSHYTHEVFNQATYLEDFDVYESDSALRESIIKFGASHIDHLQNFGHISGTSSVIQTAMMAESNRPVLKQFDTFGRRIDVVDYHHAYHKIMSHAISNGAAGHGFRHHGTAGSQVARAALIYMENQIEPGHCCPVVMTAAAIPVFRRYPGFEDLVEKLTSNVYDPRDVPMSEKRGITIGMSMTEKQGGSDVRANTTIAVPATAARTTSTGTSNGGGSVLAREEGEYGEGVYYLTGHKWFTSAPMCDAFLTLAKTTSGETGKDEITCFLVPRWKPDGNRLKNKLGDHANASSEVEYRGAWAKQIGEKGKGVRTIIEMVQSTRLDCCLGSAGTARRALQIALNHTNTRQAFGKKLIDQPLMRNVLTDLCVEAEAHTVAAMRMASAFDAYYNKQKPAATGMAAVDISSDSSSSSSSSTGATAAGGAGGGGSVEIENERAFFRIAVSVCKYFTTKRLPGFVYECMESLGGNGYVEDFPMARLYRQAPLNAIWEGSGNVIALDILLRGQAELPVLFQEIRAVRGVDAALDAYSDTVIDRITALQVSAASKDDKGGSVLLLQQSARWCVERLAVALQASILLRFGDDVVARAYVHSRIHPTSTSSSSGTGGSGGGMTYGSSYVYSDKECNYILQRNMPVFSAYAQQQQQQQTQT